MFGDFGRVGSSSVFLLAIVGPDAVEFSRERFAETIMVVLRCFAADTTEKVSSVTAAGRLCRGSGGTALNVGGSEAVKVLRWTIGRSKYPRQFIDEFFANFIPMSLKLVLSTGIVLKGCSRGGLLDGIPSERLMVIEAFERSKEACHCG